MSNVGGKITRVLQLPDGALSDDGGLPFALGPRTGHDRIEGMAGGIFEGKRIWAMERRGSERRWRKGK